MKLEKTGPKINYYSHSAACTIQYVYWGFEEADIAYSLVLLSILFNTCAATGGRHFWKTFKNRLEKQQNGCFKLLNSILAVVHTYRQKKAHNTVFSQKKKYLEKKYLQPLKFSFSCIWFLQKLPCHIEGLFNILFFCVKTLRRKLFWSKLITQILFRFVLRCCHSFIFHVYFLQSQNLFTNENSLE